MNAPPPNPWNDRRPREVKGSDEDSESEEYVPIRGRRERRAVNRNGRQIGIGITVLKSMSVNLRDTYNSKNS